jgi:hypothetical protein
MALPPSPASRSRPALSRGVAGTLAGLVAGLAYIVAQVLLSVLVRGGAADEPIARIAAVLMGPDIAPPDSEFNFTVLGMATIIHAGLAMVFGQLVSAIVWHRSTPVALVAGALTGVALYVLNFEVIAPAAFPWFQDAIPSVTMIDHALFGLVAAAVCLALRGHEPGRALRTAA